MFQCLTSRVVCLSAILVIGTGIVSAQNPASPEGLGGCIASCPPTPVPVVCPATPTPIICPTPSPEGADPCPGLSDSMTNFNTNTTGVNIPTCMSYIANYEDPTWGGINEAAMGIPPNLRSQVFIMGSQASVALGLTSTSGTFRVLGQHAGANGYCTYERTIGGVRKKFVCGYMRLSNDGCFHPSTRILMADGSTKSAEEIRVGDTLHGKTAVAPLTVKKVVEGPETLALIALKFSGRELIVTSKHPLLSSNGYVRADKLKAGDKVLNADGIPVQLESVNPYGPFPGQRVINFVVSDETEGSQTLIAEGLLSGDLAVQQSKLPGDDN